MKILWPTKIEGVGDRYGYARASDEVVKSLKRAGVLLFHSTSEDEQSAYSKQCDVAVHFVPANLFSPIKGIPNVLFTMFEAEPLPVSWIPKIRSADLLITPSRYCTQVFRRHAGGKTVKTCHLGIDPEKYYYVERRAPSNANLRLLWCGSPSLRKGWDVIAGRESNGTRYKGAFAMAFTPQHAVQLYVKTSSVAGDVAVHYDGKIVVDTRPLPEEQMIDLYHKSHVLVNTSRGEGFGMIPLEFMATGGLVISPRHTGLSDFIDDSVAEVVPTFTRQIKYGSATYCQDIHPLVLAKVMHLIFNIYDLTKRKREKASERARTEFTWDKTAERMIEILRRR